MFASMMEELTCHRMREMREHAAQARRVRRLVTARRWDRRAAKATLRARLARDAVQ